MKNNKNEIIIPFDIWKHVLVFLCSVAFVIGGFYMFHAESTRKYPEWYLKTWGTATMLFFGMGVLVFFILFFKEKKGLVINEEGILDNSTIFGLGLVKWEDIQKITTSKNNNITHIHIVFESKKEDLYIKKIKNL